MLKSLLYQFLKGIGLCAWAYVLGFFVAMGASNAGGLVNLSLHLDAPTTPAAPSGYSAHCQRVEWDL